MYVCMYWTTRCTQEVIGIVINKKKDKDSNIIIINNNQYITIIMTSLYSLPVSPFLSIFLSLAFFLPPSLPPTPYPLPSLLHLPGTLSLCASPKHPPPHSKFSLPPPPFLHSCVYSNSPGKVSLRSQSLHKN